MRYVTVEEVSVNVNAGRVGLLQEQAVTRLHALSIIGKPDAKDKRFSANGVYEVVHPLTFKRGEKFGFSGEAGRDGELSDPEAERRAAVAAAKSVDERAMVLARQRIEESLERERERARVEVADAVVRAASEARASAGVELRALLDTGMTADQAMSKVFGPAPK